MLRPAMVEGRGECRWRRREGEGKRHRDGQQDGRVRGSLVADPPGDLRDGGRFEAAGGCAILKAGAGVPSRCEAWAGGEVAGVRLEEDGRGATDKGAEAEVGVHEGPGDEVEAVEGGRGAGGRRVGERISIRVDVLKGEEGVREMVEGVRDAGGTDFGYKADMGAVVGESKGQMKSPYAVPCP
jgi:hypothetical protein